MPVGGRIAVGGRRSCCRRAGVVGASIARPRRVARRPWLRRGSSRRPRPPASSTATTASSPTSSAAAWRRSTAMPTGGRTSTSPAAPSPRRCIATPARSAARCLHAGPDPTTDLTDVDRRVPARRGRRRPRPTSPCFGSARTCCCAASATAASSARTSDWGSTAATRGRAAFSATWEGDAALPTLAIGNYLVLDDGRAEPTLRLPRQRARPARGRRDVYGRRSRSARLVLALAALQRLGPIRTPRPPRHQRPALLPRRRRSSSGGWSPARPPRLWTREEGWQTLRIWGMGIASHDLTGDGYPEVYLTSQADNKLQTLADGAEQPNYEDIALERGVTAHGPTRATTTLPSTAWHAEFEDVNNDGFIDLFVAKGNVEAIARLRGARPEQPAPRPARRHVRRERRRRPGSAELRARPRRRARRPQPRRPARPRRRQPARERPAVAQRRRRRRPRRPRRWATGSPCALEQPGREPRRHRRLGRGARRRAGHRAASCTVGGGHAGGQLGWIHFGLGEADRAEVRVTWPDGEVGPWSRSRPNRFATIERGAAEPCHWHAPTRRRMMRR